MLAFHPNSSWAVVMGSPEMFRRGCPERVPSNKVGSASKIAE
jgi:hypothetical protein